MTSRWTRAMVAAIGADDARLAVLTPAAFRPAIPHLDVWDMWQIADAGGRTLVRDGRAWWFFLTAPRDADPEQRHDHASIHLLSHDGAAWRDHGAAFPPEFAPGSREWSGSALLQDDGATLTMFFTAAGDRAGGPRFGQRLFETTGRLLIADGTARCADWSGPRETIAADGYWYEPARQEAPVDGTILGFRDPGYFRDPLDGAEYQFFTASAADEADPLAGVIGMARRDAAGWVAMPPAIDARGTNVELERPHVIHADDLYYLFWSTSRRRFAPGSPAPTGLYGMVADSIVGPWRPLNGTGLVAGNPEAAPWQAYCWWVTGDGEVASFLDYAGTTDPQALPADARRQRFGGTPAPFFRLRFDGDAVTIAG